MRSTEFTLNLRSLTRLEFFLSVSGQEHAVRLAVRLLSPPSGPDNRGTGSHLIAYAPMLGAALDGMTSVDSVNILALYGMVCIFLPLYGG